MTRKDFATMVRSIGIPSAYQFFSNDTAEDPPFICFFETRDDDVKADNTNYVKIREMVIELYTAEKDFVLENTVEAVLKGAEMVYSVEAEYLDDEHLFLTVYTMEVVIDGE